MRYLVLLVCSVSFFAAGCNKDKKTDAEVLKEGQDALKKAQEDFKAEKDAFQADKNAEKANEKASAALKTREDALKAEKEALKVEKDAHVFMVKEAAFKAEKDALETATKALRAEQEALKKAQEAFKAEQEAAKAKVGNLGKKAPEANRKKADNATVFVSPGEQFSRQAKKQELERQKDLAIVKMIAQWNVDNIPKYRTLVFYQKTLVSIRSPGYRPGNKREQIDGLLVSMAQKQGEITASWINLQHDIKVARANFDDQIRALGTSPSVVSPGLAKLLPFR